jgi:hypothetical protein
VQRGCDEPVTEHGVAFACVASAGGSGPHPLEFVGDWETGPDRRPEGEFLKQILESLGMA